MLNYEFKVNPEQWNIISEVGYPEDGTVCIVLFKGSKNQMSWTISMYDEECKNFYVNYGYGGLVLEREEAYAWCELQNDMLKEV
ncbi:MAG: hypothetical protein K2N42_04930 [Anaeroplasmataceae bacterium]|nr:hypothetical protein [Anaeroplasmataceae bacterium]